MDWSRIAALLLPARCLLCGSGAAHGNLCAGCEGDLPRIAFACSRCGIPMEVPEEDRKAIGPLLCGACIRHPPPFDATIAALHYAFPVTVLVQRFKFRRNLACGAILSAQLIGALSEAAADLIVPVPLHRARRFRRVFNQAEVLAWDVGKALGIRVAPGALLRVRRTRAQSGLSASDRRRNLCRAFRGRPVGAVHVALIDDVMTTGSTVSECARELKRCGAKWVSVWVAARAPLD